DCKEPYEIKKEDISDKIVLSSPVIYRAKGCDKCNYIGYKGRSSISEIIFLDEEVRSFINKGASPDEIMKLAQKKGTLTLLQSGLKRVEEGITSLEEILSITANY
ncbi:MAG: type II/IV secretion system protein, partial [Candidatus Omnitrophica bacterium]|nr:type II/IV secretion system protein [Candidatus Omnitrophota bacterium]